MIRKTEQRRSLNKAAGQSAVFRLKPACAALLLVFTAQSAQANPVGGAVISGQASFAANGNTLTVTNTPGAIINWQSFSIGANEVTRFAQQSAASTVLNRVVTANNPSSILGTLSSNGRVFLVNPGGVIFGKGATVDVAGLVATTLKLSDTDFQAGRYHFTDVPGAQNVSNAGNITAQSGGQIYLIAPDVKNTGVIKAPNGEILLAAGHSVELVDTANPNLRVNITAPAGDATNVGTLVAEAGSLGLFGAVTRNSGVVSADSAVAQGGRIVFRASQRVEAGGTVTANSTATPVISSEARNPQDSSPAFGMTTATQNGNGGSIDLSGASVAVGGTVSADGTQQGGAIAIAAGGVSLAGRISATGGSGQGGSIDIQSETTALHNVYSTLDASGATGGSIREIAGHQITSSATYLATGSHGQGGRIDLSAPATKLLSAQIDASGATHGGQIRVGGEFQGGKPSLSNPFGVSLSNPTLPNAETLAISAGSTIKADGGASSSIPSPSRGGLGWGWGEGNGGTVILWSDLESALYADVSAQGKNGAGGFIEISSAEKLLWGGTANAGVGGQVLMDPKNIVIQDATAGGVQYNLTLGYNYVNLPRMTGSTLTGSEYFGSAVSLSGTQLAVGAYGDNGFANDAFSVGAVYLFNNPYTTPTLSGIIGKGYTGAGNFDVTTLASSDFFGFSVSLSGTQLAVGAYGDDGFGDSAANSGAVYLFNNLNTTPTLSGVIGKGYTGTGNLDLTALEANDQFGHAVSLSGTQLAVGANFDDGSGNTVANSGAVYLFNTPYTTPTLSGIVGQGYVGAGDFNLTALEANDEFGGAVSLSGTQLAVGAQWDDGFGNTLGQSGAVYLFNNPFGATALSGTIGRGYSGTGDFNLIAALGAGDFFGSAVSLSGTQLAVGAVGDDGSGDVASASGAVYLFNNLDTTPTLSGVIGKGYTGGAGNYDVTTLEAGDWFGSSVSLSGSGTQLAVGAFRDGGSGNVTPDSGAVYLFNNLDGPTLSGIIGRGYTGAGSYDPGDALEAGDQFGSAVSLSGTRLAVGAIYDDGSGNAAVDSGAVYLFNNPYTTPALSGIIGKGYTGAGNYDLTALEANDQFGLAVSLSGTQLAVGAIYDDGSGNLALDSGAVYLFNNLDTTPALSGIIGKGYSGAGSHDLTALEADDRFGSAVSLSGTQLAVGAFSDDGFGNLAMASGAVYLFNNLNTTPTLSGIIGQGYTGAGNYDLTALEAFDLFGSSVSLSGTQLAVGAYLDDGSGNVAANSGAVYLFNNLDTTPTLSGIIGKGYSGAGNYDLAALETYDSFGGAVSLSGTQLAVGAYADDGSGNLAQDSGAVYLFTLTPGSASDPATGQTFAANPGADSTLTPASITAILNTGSSLTLQANNDITVANAIIANNLTGWGGDLTLQAGRSILVNADINTDNGALNLIANDLGANLLYRDAGAAVLNTSMATLTAGSIALTNSGGDILAGAMTANIGAINLTASNNISIASEMAVSSLGDAQNVVFNADSDGSGDGAIFMNAGSSITSNGGNITLGGGVAGDGSGNAIGTSVNGITLDGASINAGGGNISLRGTGVAGTGAWRYGVFLQNGATVTSTGTGAITLDGTGGAAINGNYGVMLETNSQVSTVNGAISITGHGGAGTTSENVGVGVQLGARVLSTGAGTITLNGTGGAGTDTNRGVYIDGAGTAVTSFGGNVSITGQGAGTGFDNRGIYISGGAKVTSTGAASVTLDGTGSAAGTDFNYGVYLKNLGTEVSASNGAVSVTGHGAGSGTDNYGAWVTDYAKVASAGAGAITLDGFGGASTGSINTGAYISSNATISATGTGGIVVNGTGGSTGTAGLSNRGVRVSSAASINTNSGNIGITGTGGYEGDGVQVVGGAHVQSGTGAITLDGTAVDGSNDAVYVTDVGTLVTTGGNIVISGDNFSTIGSGNRGVAITSSAQVVATGAGIIAMTGQGGHEGDGLHVHGGALVQSGTGLITLTGTSGDGIGTNWDWGVEVGDAGTLVTSGGGMTITGISTSTDGTYSNYGLFVRTGAKLTTTAGAMTLTGTKGAGTTSDAVRLSGTPAGGVVNTAAGLSINGMGDVVVDIGSILNVTGNANISTDRNILFAANSSLASSAGAVNISLNPGNDGGIRGGIYLDTGSSLASNGGSIQMGSASIRSLGNGTVTGGITFNSGITVLGDITAGAGNVTMYGEGANNNFADGITFAGGTLSSNGIVNIDGIAHSYSTNRVGLNPFAAGVDFINAGTRLTTQTGTVTVTGTNTVPWSFGTEGTGGVMVETGTIVETTGAGTLTFNGAANAYGASWGVGVLGTIQTTAAGGGAITLYGTNLNNADGGVVIWDGHVLSGGGAINLTGQTSSGGSAVGWLNTAPNALALGGPNSGNITIKGLVATDFIDFNANGGFAHVINAGSSALSITNGSRSFPLNNVQISAGDVTLSSVGDITVSGVTATGNVAITATAGRISGSGGASTDVSTGGTLNLTATGIGYQSQLWPYTTNRVGVSAGGAVTLTTTGTGISGNIYLRGDAAMTLNPVTTDAGTMQWVDLIQQTGSLTMPVTQTGNDTWYVNAAPGITFLSGSSLTVGSATFTSTSNSGITAQGDLSVRALTGDLSFYSTSFYNAPITAGGIVTLLSDTGFLTLGAVTASNTGLPVTAAAIIASAPMGGINLNEGLTATGSGGISLLAYYSIDLDYADIAPNLITAAGNVNIQSTNGSITNGGSAQVTGASVVLDGATGVDTGDVITATTGSVTVTSANGPVTLAGVSAATGVTVTAGGTNTWDRLFSYGGITAAAGDIVLSSATTFESPNYWGATPIEASGNVTITAPGGIGFDSIRGNVVTLNSAAAPIVRNAAGGTPDLVTANTLIVTAAGGIDLSTSVAALQTSNTGAGDTVISNTGALTVGGMTNTGWWGSITLNNAGSMTLSGAMSANGRIDLTASEAASDIFVGSTVTSGDDMTINAGRDLSVGPGGGRLIATAGSQTINVGRDMSVVQDGGTAYVDTLDGELGLQTINVGRNLLVQVTNSSGTEAHIEGAAGQEINVGGNLTLNALDNDQTRINANGGDQTITVGGNMLLNAAQDIAHVRSLAGTQAVTVSGNLTLTGTGARMSGSLGQTVLVGGNLGVASGRIFSGSSATLQVGNDLLFSGNGTIGSTGDLALSSGGRVDDQGATGAAVDAGGALSVTAGAGINLHTAAGSITTTNTGAGNTVINNNGALTVGNMSDAGTITLNNSAALSQVTGTAIAANALNVTAGAGINLHTAAGSITTTNTGPGGTIIANTGALTVGNMSDAGTITLSSNMALAQATGTAIAANALDVTTSGGIALTTQVANLTTSNTGAGNTVIANNGTLTTVNGMTDTSGSITLNNAGSVAVTGGISAIGAALTNGITLSATGALSDITLSGQGGANTASGSISLNAGQDIIHTGGAQQINSYAGAVTLAAGRDIVHTDANQINSFSGAMLLNAGRDILHTGSTTGQINTYSGTVTLMAGRDIVHTDANQINSSSGAMLLNAGRDIVHSGSANQINNNSGSLTITAGQDFIHSASGQINTNTGALSITAGRDFLHSASGQINTSSGVMTLGVGGDLIHTGSGRIRTSSSAQTITVAGDFTVSGTYSGVSSGGGQTITVGNNLTVSNAADIYNSSNGVATTLQVGNDLVLSGGQVWSNAPLYGSVGHDVSITGASYTMAGLFGTPDIGSEAAPFTVGGVIRLNDGTGPNSGAEIHSSLPYSIWIHFPNLTSGGYFVNGTEEVSNGMSGFYADGSPAVLGSNLHIAYRPQAIISRPMLDFIARSSIPQFPGITGLRANALRSPNINLLLKAAPPGAGDEQSQNDPALAALAAAAANLEPAAPPAPLPVCK